MNSFNSKLIFQNFDDKIDEICDNTIKNVYSEFIFRYFNFSQLSDLEIEINENNILKYLFYFLKTNKFLTYIISNNTNFQNHSIRSNFFNNNSDKKATIREYNVVLCVEKQCFIFESIEINFFNSILSKVELSKINLTNDTILKKMNTSLSKNDLQAKEESDNFYNHFSYALTNQFLQSTFIPISSFLIRRFFQPSSYFKDQSFLKFNEQTNFYDQMSLNIKIKITNLIKSLDLHELEKNYDKLKTEIKHLIESKNNDEQNKVINFNDDDFIYLRVIYSNEKGIIFYLVFHIPSHYIFMMKKCENTENREIDFYKKYSYRCFTRFYGTIKTKFHLKIIYEFMSKGSLSNYLKKK